ncbi:unnamed protein product [Nezara viridula]|uniref:Uncharacterized protein n=1 Tax=Nezara viridula TaxID=85310 RepID=A0A9P0HBT3_NEZVI|nr:unnamed protein product [Nezara viridula]
MIFVGYDRKQGYEKLNIVKKKEKNRTTDVVNQNGFAYQKEEAAERLQLHNASEESIGSCERERKQSCRLPLRSSLQHLCPSSSGNMYARAGYPSSNPILIISVLVYGGNTPSSTLCNALPEQTNEYVRGGILGRFKFSSRFARGS